MKFDTESLWRETNSQLRLFIKARIPDPSLTDDILQDVFIKIHSNIDNLKDQSKICSWIYTITRNAITDLYRRKRPDTEFFDMPDLADEPEELSAANEIALELGQMIDTLPGKYARALRLVELNGLSQIALADREGISISGAKSRVQRGRKLLKECLMQCCHFEFDRFGTIINHRPHHCCCCNPEV